MQFQVPQFIESEDKLVGPFSLRQFVYIVVAAGAGAILYFTIGGVIALFLGVILVGSGIAFGFVKVGGRPLLDIFLAAINFYWKPQTYVWRAEHTTPTVSPAQHHEEASPIAASIEKIASGVALHKGWETLQTGGKISARELIDRKMENRYEILHRQAGDRSAARRVDYR